MKPTTALLLLLTGSLAVSVCAFAGIDGKMAQGIRERELCVVDNVDAESEFRNTLVRSLRTRGYTVKWIADKGDCDVAMTFHAAYGVTTGWGPRRVLKAASFVVYRYSEPIASVQFRYEKSMFGGGSDGTVEQVISQMVFKLLPPAP
jgi:hypothetical protein